MSTGVIAAMLPNPICAAASYGAPDVAAPAKRYIRPMSRAVPDVLVTATEPVSKPVARVQNHSARSAEF